MPFLRGALISQEASLHSCWELMGSWLKVMRQIPNRLSCNVLLAAKLWRLTACCECDSFSCSVQKQDVFNVKGWGEMVIIEARGWMAPPFANRFGNSVEQVEEFAGWENRSPGCYFSPVSAIRTFQCRESLTLALLLLLFACCSLRLSQGLLLMLLWSVS